MTSDKCAIIQQWYEKTLSGPNIVYNVFINYYGEERVDMYHRSLEDCILYFTQKENDDITYYNFLYYIGNHYDIIVHFPEVRITNENDAHVDVKDLWAKIPLIITRTRDDVNDPSSYECKMYNSFTLTRSNYTMDHLRSDYMHSHCPGVPFDGSPWLSCCLGNGPIKRTIATLCTSPDIDIWSLFVYELDLYVKTESLSGGPYRYMSRITHSKASFSFNYDDNRYFYTDKIHLDNKARRLICDFLRCFLKQKKLPFKYSTSWTIAMSYFDIVMLLSKSFIEWFNNANNNWNIAYSVNQLISTNILKPAKTIDNKIHYKTNSRQNQAISDTTIHAKMDNKELFMFKGHTISVVIEEPRITDNNFCYLLNPELVRYIITIILGYINFNYGTNQQQRC